MRSPEHASVLADSAEYLEEIDVERAERALKKAEERLAKAKTDARSAVDGDLKDITEASASLNRAATRLKLAARRIVR